MQVGGRTPLPPPLHLVAAAGAGAPRAARSACDGAMHHARAAPCTAIRLTSFMRSARTIVDCWNALRPSCHPASLNTFCWFVCCLFAPVVCQECIFEWLTAQKTQGRMTLQCPQCRGAHVHSPTLNTAVAAGASPSSMQAGRAGAGSDRSESSDDTFQQTLQLVRLRLSLRRLESMAQAQRLALQRAEAAQRRTSGATAIAEETEP